MSALPDDSSHSSTATTLIRRAQCRDPQAWNQLVDLYGPLVYYWCRRKGELPPDDAADVFQEVFAAVSRGLARFDLRRQGRTFRGWLWTVTRNKLRDRFRRRAAELPPTGGTAALERLEQFPDPWDERSADPRDRSELQSLYQRALDQVRGQFEERTWQAFWRSVVEGQATDEIAADLELTPNAVRQYKSRVLRRLRQELGDLPEDT